jgi:hypothetical protein
MILLLADDGASIDCGDLEAASFRRDLHRRRGAETAWRRFPPLNLETITLATCVHEVQLVVYRSEAK